MQNKMISIPEEIFQKLKEESNASNLITRLLIEHYKTTKVETVEEIESAEKRLEEKRKEFINKLEVEDTKLTTKKELIKKQTEFIQEKYEVDKVKLQEKKESIKQYYKLFTQREMSEDDCNLYLHRMEEEAGTGYGLGQFIEEQNILILDPEHIAEQEARDEAMRKPQTKSFTNAI